MHDEEIELVFEVDEVSYSDEIGREWDDHRFAKFGDRVDGDVQTELLTSGSKSKVDKGEARRGLVEEGRIEEEFARELELSCSLVVARDDTRVVGGLSGEEIEGGSIETLCEDEITHTVRNLQLTLKAEPVM